MSKAPKSHMYRIHDNKKIILTPLAQGLLNYTTSKMANDLNDAEHGKHHRKTFQSLDDPPETP